MIGGKTKTPDSFLSRINWIRNNTFNNDTIRIRIRESAHDINDNTVNNPSSNNINSDIIFI